MSEGGGKGRAGPERAVAAGWCRAALPALLALALLHGLLYALLVPLWEAPDEPMVYEYAALVAALGRMPAATDHSPAVEARLVAALNRADFWTRRMGRAPAAAPATWAESRRLLVMPRQVGGDPPLYFALAGGVLRLADGWSVERQALLLRLLNALLLPGVAFCAYGAAREIAPERLELALAVAGFAAAQPMFAAIGASANNDGLANLLGAALAWLTLRLLRLGLNWRRALLAVALAGLALLAKRTAAPWLALPAGCGLAGALRLARFGRRPRAPGSWRRIVGGGLGALALLGVVLGWAAGQIDWSAAGFWLNAGQETHAARGALPARNGSALRLAAGAEVFQPLPLLGMQLARDKNLIFTAYVWSEAPARGRLVIYADDQRYEAAFALPAQSQPRLTAPITQPRRHLMFGLIADEGAFYATQLTARADGLPGNLLLNGGAGLPALKAGSPIESALSYGMARTILWAAQSRALLRPFPFAAWWRLLFDSFWGVFGWMDRPFATSPGWRGALLAVMAVSGAGLAAALARARPGPQRRQLAAMAGLLIGALALLLLSSMARPLHEQLAQGRYLFPLLVPAGILLAFGQGLHLSGRWLAAWLAAWLAGWALFAGAALAFVARSYGAW